MDGHVVAEIALPAGSPGAVRNAATTLRHVAGGFEHMGRTVGGAAASLSSWKGLASLEFNHTCVSHQGSATQADQACEHAATVLEGYATKLQAAIDKVKTMQDEATELLKVEHQANLTADSERLQLQGAHQSMRMAAMDSALDGGAAMHGAQAEVTRHSDALAAATTAATNARTRIDELKRDAAVIRDEVDDDGNSAAGRLNGALAQLPTVDGAPGGSVGGTPLTSATEKNAVTVTIVIFRVGGSLAVVKEHTADGKWKVTRIEGAEGGVEFDPVPGAGVDGGGKVGRLGAGADVEAALVAQYKHGSTYSFDSERDADRFIKYKDESPPHPYYGGRAGVFMPRMSDAERRNVDWADDVKPESTYDEGGFHAEASASAGGVEGGADADLALGRKVNQEDGATTIYSKASGSLSGKVTEGPLSAGGKISGETVTALTRADDGRPTSYSVTVSGAAEGSAGASIPGEHHGLKGALTGDEAHGVRIERQTTLDLNDPANRRAVNDYVHSSGQDPDAAQRLADRLHDAGRVDVRTYDTGSTKSGANIDTKIVKVEVSHTGENATLSGMDHRGPGPDRTVVTAR
jgi:type VII secretion system ESX-1 substrate